MGKHTRFVLVTLILCMVFGAGCASSDSGTSPQTDGDSVSDGDDTPDGDSEGEGEGESDAPFKVDGVTSATPGVGSMVLTESHGGWKDPGCFSCHTVAHNNGMTPPQCASCHGSNGAEPRPAGHATKNCTNCHTLSHAIHAFSDPNDCIACHKFESGSLCPVTEQVDAVVVGAGGGGLAAATTLALAGKDVVLIEKNNKVGGYMGNFKRGPYTFEISLHAMGGFNAPDKGTAAVFENLDILDRVTPIALDPAYKIVMPDMSLLIPKDEAEYEQMLKEMFPEDAQGIADLFAFLRESNVFFKELAAARVAGGEVWDEFFRENTGKVLELFGYMSITLSDFLLDYFENERLHMIFTQLAAYIGAEPDKVQAAFFMVMWFGYTFDGYYYFEGGSQSVVDAMEDVIEENGGRILLNTLVEKIVVEDGRVTQVQTKDDVCFNTDYVISNASAPATLFEMVGEEHLPQDYAARVKAMPVSVSALVLYFATDKDYTEYFEGAHEVFINESYDQAKNWDWFYASDTANAPYLLTNYSLLNDDIAPPGHNVMVLATYLEYDWNDMWHFFEDRAQYLSFKQGVADSMLQRAESILPDLRQHISVLSIATPPTLEQFTLNPEGTFYGFDNLPDNALLNRLEQETPIEGLYLAGQWTFPGPGQSAVIQSGQIAAGLVIGAMDQPADGDSDPVSDGDGENP